jgi:uncharacterized repeat protein (TIGR03837 family)
LTLDARILCRVVDNFGDAGVCWRLARQLSTESGWRVTLAIDQPGVLARFGADASAGVRIEPWQADAPDRDRAAGAPACDVLISAFGCEPPAALRAVLAGAPRRPLWVNLEYLSAEPWIDGCHGLPSVRPADGAVEHFYYPGFTERSGGLLRERGLLERRDAFVGSAAQQRWLQALDIAPSPGARLVTLFCYPETPLPDWFALLADGARPHHVLVPESVADGAIAAFFGNAPAPGGVLRRAQLAVQRIPFLTHDDYDRLLWSADLNFVRGEDSWIRAHWAARPFVWQPYAQAEGTHLVKLRAFLARLSAGAAADAMMLAWSDAGALAPAWLAFDGQLDALAPAWRDWCTKLGAQRDLATRLVDFCMQRL